MGNAGGRRSFNSRRFVSGILALSAVLLTVTGTMNHRLALEPAPTVARHAWMGAHNSAAFVFVVSLLWHLVLNRRALLGHLRGVGAGRELAWALLVVAVTTAAAAGHAFLAQ